MRYREVGNTGLRVSQIGFGAGDNAGLMIGGTLAEQCSVLDRALQFGINYIDTAAGYGSNASETSLGRVLRELRVLPLLNTKVEGTTEQTADVAAAVVASVEGSLQRVGVDHFDIVQIHNSPVFQRPEQFTGWMPMMLEEYLGPKGALAGLARLRQAGKVRFFGLINERPNVALAKALLATGEFSLLNVQYNLLNPSAGMPTPRGLKVDLDNGDIIGFAAAQGAGVAIFSPLARGVLTDRAAADGSRHPLAGTTILRNPEAYERSLARARALKFLAHDGRTLGQTAIQFILQHPGVTMALGGFTAVEQVDEMVAALDAAPLSEVDMARVAMVWRANFGEF